IVAVGLLQPLLGPGGDIELRRGGGVERRGNLARPELHPLLRREVMVELPEIASHAILPVHVLRDADEAEARILEADAVVCVPALEIAVVYFHRDAADGRAVIDPAGMAEMHPGFPVA